MTRQQQLLSRLDAIALSFAASGHGRALLALGSCGRELDRLDEFSDLDFFAIVENGHKQAYIDDLNWLSSISPVGYAFKNTKDGYKLLYADGILCELAVIDEAELETAIYAPGRIVWQAGNFDPTKLRNAAPAAANQEQTVEWLVGEALTNLYVGLCRYKRGEKISAMRFVQGYAVDRLVDLAEYVEVPRSVIIDGFSRERRFEQRFPQLAGQLPEFLQGYEATPQSALAILSHLDRHFDINPYIHKEIVDLCGGIDVQDNKS